MMETTFLDALRLETATLQAEHPVLAGGLGKAFTTVADGAVFPEEDGREAMVRSSDGQRFYHVNGSCSCPSATFNEAPCRHRLALRLYQRVSTRLHEEEERWEPAGFTPGQTEPVVEAPAIPQEHLVVIQGRPFVKVAGLLALAHQRGLQSLRTVFTYNGFCGCQGEPCVLLVEMISYWSLCGFMISGGDGTVAFWLPLFRWLRCLNIGFIISGINYRVVLPNTRNFFAFSPTKHP